MKKTILGLLTPVLIVLLLLNSISAAAGSARLSLTQSGTLRSGRLFYITVGTDTPLCALQADLRYDAGSIQFQSVSAKGSGGYVRYSLSKDLVSIVYSSSSARSGALVTFKFKALKNTDTDITLDPACAAVSDSGLIGFDSVSVLTLSIGQNASSKTSSVSKTASAAASKNSSVRLSDGLSTRSESAPKTIADYSREQPSFLKPILIAAGMILLVSVTLTVGFILGKKRNNKLSDEETEPQRDITPSDTEPTGPPEENDQQP